MKVPSGTKLEGLSDSDVAVTDYEELGDAAATAKVLVGRTTFDILTYRPTGKQAPLLVLFTKKVGFASIVPAASGTPLGALSEMENVAFIYVPKDAAGKFVAPTPIAASGPNTAAGGAE